VDESLARNVVIVFGLSLLLIAGFTQLQHVYSPNAQTVQAAPINPQAIPALPQGVNVPDAIAAGVHGLLPVLSTGTGADLVSSSRTITVSGDGRVSSAADEVRVSANVITKSSSALTAQQLNADVSKKVREAIAALNVPADKVRTLSYSVQPEYKYENGQSYLIGYTATNSLQVDMDDRMDDAGRLIDAVSTAGALVQDVSFSLSNAKQATLGSQALSAAGRDAVQKALLVAESMGVRVKQLLTANAYSNSYSPQPYYANRGDYNMAQGASAPSQVSPGQLDMTASVSAVFEIE